MDKDFWYQRWRSGQIGFHHPDVNPLLIRFWESTGVSRSARVLVPLCGKSVDMTWLSRCGHRVLGVELSPVAVEAYFAEHGLDPQVRTQDGLEIWDAGDIRVFCGDLFALTPDLLGRVGAVYDRASLIALPPDMRGDYVEHMDRLLPPGGAPTLLITLEYADGQIDGPPFSVTADEVDQRYQSRWLVDRIHEEDALAANPRLREKGLTGLQQVVYLLTPRSQISSG